MERLMVALALTAASACTPHVHARVDAVEDGWLRWVSQKNARLIRAALVSGHCAEGAPVEILEDPAETRGMCLNRSLDPDLGFEGRARGDFDL